MMKQFLLPAVMAALLPAVMPASPTHLDIAVPAIKDTDLVGPVKSVEFEVCKNVAAESTKEKDEYDKAGNLLKVTEWDTKGKIAETTSYFYDGNGCYTRQLYINLAKGFTNDWTVILNPETHQIALKNKRNDDIIIDTFSPDGYLLSFKMLDDNKKQVMAATYDRYEDNRTRKYTWYDGSTPQYIYYYKWKDNGFIDMEKQHYLQEKAERLHTYEYLLNDSHGNWTQRILVRYDIGGRKKEKVYEHTVQRTIEYYDTVDTATGTTTSSNKESMALAESGDGTGTTTEGESE